MREAEARALARAGGAHGALIIVQNIGISDVGSGGGDARAMQHHAMVPQQPNRNQLID